MSIAEKCFLISAVFFAGGVFFSFLLGRAIKGLDHALRTGTETGDGQAVFALVCFVFSAGFLFAGLFHL